MIQLQKFISALNLSIKANIFFFSFFRTKFILSLIKLLIKHGYILGFRRCSRNASKILVFLKLNLEQTGPIMISCKVLSTPSRPVYMQYGRYSQGTALVVLSTSAGIMCQKEAYFRKLGGIALCKVL